MVKYRIIEVKREDSVFYDVQRKQWEDLTFPNPYRTIEEAKEVIERLKKSISKIKRKVVYND